MEELQFCTAGGCTAKLGPGALKRVLEKLPKAAKDPSLLIGYDSSDDAAVYQVSDTIAIVQTLDFFPPMVEDPYLFGQIAAANALSDIYAMGGEAKTALNIVCFPESMDLNILGEILQGGETKVAEAGGSLAGGHSILDTGIKYGLSVMGTIDPKGILSNTGGQPGDGLVLTKKLGVGLVCTANRIGEASQQAFSEATASMTTLNQKASQILRKYPAHACTDVTGFGFLGHLNEMLGSHLCAIIDADRIPIIEDARHYAEEFLLTAAAQRNRNHLDAAVTFEGVSFAMEEILFDPQTSGGLLCALPMEAAKEAAEAMKQQGLFAEVVGRLAKVQEQKTKIRVVSAGGAI